MIGANYQHTSIINHIDRGCVYQFYPLMEGDVTSDPEKAAMLCFRLEELSRYVKRNLHRHRFVADDTWWLLSRQDGIHASLADALLITEQLGYKNKNDEMLPK
jgi:hypothetical protein